MARIHQRHIEKLRPKYIPNAHTVVYRPMTTASGNQATKPRILIHHSIDPQKANPNRNPSQPASRTVVTRRIAHNNGVGATNMRKPQSSGGKDAHIRAADRSTAKICMRPRD